MVKYIRTFQNFIAPVSGVQPRGQYVFPRTRIEDSRATCPRGDSRAARAVVRWAGASGWSAEAGTCGSPGARDQLEVEAFVIGQVVGLEVFAHVDVATRLFSWERPATNPCEIDVHVVFRLWVLNEDVI